MKKVVVLTHARSGSNLLLSLLNSHPQLYFHGEVYKPDYVGTFRASPVLKDLIGVDPTELRDRDHLKFFKKIFALSPTHHKAVGFKLFFNHSKAILKYIKKDPDISIILLERENRLASFSSQLIGEKTGVWWTKDRPTGNSAVPSALAPKLPFDADAFSDYCTRIDKKYSDFKGGVTDPSRVHEIKYTDLLKEETWRKMLIFLDAKPEVTLSPGVVKQNTSSPIERFENQALVKSYLESIGKSNWTTESL